MDTKKGRFTYAIAEHGFHHITRRDNQPVRTAEALNQFSPYRRRSGYRRYSPQRRVPDIAFVFEPRPGIGHQNIARSIGKLPFIQELYENGVMVANFRLGADSVIVASDTLNTFPPKLGALVGTLSFLWQDNDQMREAHVSFDSLITPCTSIERVVGSCANCKHEYLDCMTRMLQAWMDKQPEDVSMAVVNLLSKSATANDMDDEDLDELFEEFGTEYEGWTFVSPGKTGKAFQPRLRAVYEHDMDELDGLHEDRSERAKKAAQTRRLTSVCRDRCYFFLTCSFVGRTWRGKIRECHNGTEYYRPSKGPYTEEMLETAKREVLYGAMNVSRFREEASIIAANSGLETRLLGKPLQLVGIDFPDRHRIRACHGRSYGDASQMVVEFKTTDRYRESRIFSFKDAVELCRLPRWCGGQYEYNGFRTPHVPMTDDELLLYWEIRNHNYIKGYNYYCGFSTPEIMRVSWRSHSFAVQGHCGWERHIESLRDIEPVLDHFPMVAAECDFTVKVT